MDKTSRIGLTVFSAASDTEAFRVFRTAIAGDGDESNMIIIDDEIAKLQDRVIFSPSQPAGQPRGGVWNEILK